MPYDLKGRNVLITGGSRGLAINFQSSEAVAKDLAQEIEEKYHIKATIIKADVGVTAECERCVRETVKALGGLDILIGNAGYTKFTDNWGDLEALSEEDWDKCFAVNVKGKLALMRAVGPIFRENPEGGCFSGRQLNGGNQYGEERIKSLKERAALKKETDLQDCANAFVDLASNTSITGAKIQVDAGLYIAAP
ncbi:putative short chain dehydrogenase reductase [Diplodia seriata]|uniref:Putative short chain dehydrogenase reductase n=1 Tax=Diplodia seriata TaxID=420778 RepID=A0A0G2EJD6_9PEZI|nr:putative short chain dehydrogenase reductase [Diplodia seriata]